MAFFDVSEAEMDLAALADRAYERVMACIEDRQSWVEQAAGRLNLQRYDAFLAMCEARLAGLMEQADRQLRLHLEQKQGKLNTLTASLQALNPAASCAAATASSCSMTRSLQISTACRKRPR